MLQKLRGMPSYVAAFKATGEVTKDDYNTVLVPEIERVDKEHGHIHFLMVMENSGKDFSLGAWLKDAAEGLKQALERRPNSPQLFEIQTFPTLHHLVSTVSGVLRPDCDALDAFAAAFPCGSITGAPKIRAMQIIDELESTRRGVSFGAVGYFGFDGGMEWNVAIRTMTCINDQAHFHTGGGIVWDSDAPGEYSEMQLKATALKSVLRR